MTDRATPGIEHLDLDPIEVPADGTIAPISGDGTGTALPPIDEAAYPPGAQPLPEGDPS